MRCQGKAKIFYNAIISAKVTSNYLKITFRGFPEWISWKRSDSSADTIQKSKLVSQLIFRWRKKLP